jgi:SAM-dependent methyltransferase
MIASAEFDSYASEYDAALEQGISLSGENKDYFARGRIAWLATQVASVDAKIRSVMDFGCGTGSATTHLLDLLNIESVTGTDISSESIRVAALNHQDEGRAQFLQLDAYRPNALMDLAFCNGVFHHIPPSERVGAVRFVYDSLRPGGLFSFWENNPWNPATLYVMSKCPFDKDAQTLSPLQAVRLLKIGGFEVLRTDFLFIFPNFLRRFRGIEPPLARLPLGTQYQVLCRKI